MILRLCLIYCFVIEHFQAKKNTNHLRLPNNNNNLNEIGLLMVNGIDEMISFFYEIFHLNVKTNFRHHLRLVVMILELQSFRQKVAFIRLNMQWRPYRMPEPV